jgi:hypothetical protein
MTKRLRSAIHIDPELSRLAYRCFPDGCPSDRTCCIGLAVAVSRHEVRVIDSLMDELARVAPWLREPDGYVDVFVRDPSGLQIEPRDDDGTCPFLFQRGGRALCSVHHVALRSGRPVAGAKPQACRHWPLVVEARGKRVRIAVHPNAQAIGCVAPAADLPGQPTVRDAFAAEIEELRAAYG